MTEPTTTTTEAASSTTTEAPPPETTTTAAPPETTTAAPAETTTAPAETTTAAQASTTEAPPETTSTAQASTTEAPSTTTTAALSTTTTEAASSTTTAASGEAPAVGEVTVAVDPDDGTEQHPNSIQVASDVALKLTWSTQNATGVRIDPLGSFGASDTVDLPTEDATYTLVALGDGGAESAPYTIEVHTHEPGEVVSHHVDVLSGVAKLISYQALVDDQPAGIVAPGQEIVISVVATLDTDSVSVDDQDVPLSETGDGHKEGSLTLTAPDAGGDVVYTLKAVKDGDAADTQTIAVSVAPSSTTSTTGSPTTTTTSPSSTTSSPPTTTTAASTTTTAASTTTTAPPATTTAGGALENPTWGAAQYSHGQTIALQVDAPGVPEDQTVYFSVEIDAGGGAWKPLQKAQAQVKDGKAAVPVVLEDGDDTPDGQDELCRFRFHASLEDDAPPGTTTAP